MNDRVFISYSNHDSDVANTICTAIEAGGRACWIAPRDIEPSSEWAEQIIDGIHAAGVMVLVFSSWSNKSPQVRREVERAINRDIPVIPFRIEKILPVKSLEFFLSTQHWFDAFDGRLDAHVSRLCGLVQSVSQRRAGLEDDAAARTGAPDTATATDLKASVATALSPAAAHTREEDLAFIAHELAREIGPIARYLVQRASAASTSSAGLVDRLAAELQEPKVRATFVARCRARLGL